MADKDELNISGLLRPVLRLGFGGAFGSTGSFFLLVFLFLTRPPFTPPDGEAVAWGALGFFCFCLVGVGSWIKLCAAVGLTNGGLCNVCNTVCFSCGNSSKKLLSFTFPNGVLRSLVLGSNKEFSFRGNSISHENKSIISMLWLSHFFFYFFFFLNKERVKSILYLKRVDRSFC